MSAIKSAVCLRRREERDGASLQWFLNPRFLISLWCNYTLGEGREKENRELKSGRDGWKISGVVKQVCLVLCVSVRPHVYN